MPTILTHPAVPLALGIGLGNRIIPGKLLLAGILLSILPDLDVIFLQMGVSWHSVYGHRGFTHSIAFSGVCALLLAICFRERSAAAAIFGFVVVLSHPLLDAITWGGQGVALYWPFSDHRFSLSYQPLPASPLSIPHFMRWGGFVLMAEFRMVWLPCIGFTLAVLGLRKLIVPKPPVIRTAG